MSVKVSDLKSGMGFTAHIENTPSSGVIHSDGNYIYLCQNEKEGYFIEDRHGYEFSWIIFLESEETEIMPGMSGVTNLVVFENNFVIRDPPFIDPAFIFPGTKFKGIHHHRPVDGVLHVQNSRIFICFNEGTPGMEAENKHGYLYSWALCGPNKEGIVEFSSDGVTITEYIIHNHFSSQANDISDCTFNYENKKGEIEKLRGVLNSISEKNARPKVGFGFPIFYTGSIISFGCGEIRITIKEVAGFLKIMKGLKKREILTGDIVDKVIELSRNLLK